ncbi:uncharacterized protein G2W53_035347 [Senna tora]|uniref:Uncharacterized protein n=1 Tax=Senna tora TaxID=362788 RepID=A0A834T3D8_9FABA|nr:uncharacterized protein G2W53_035347 [Senna tora]
MLAKMKVEEESKEQCKKGKEAEERYKNSLEDGKKREEQQETTIRKLRMENRKLTEESEISNDIKQRDEKRRRRAVGGGVG